MNDFKMYAKIETEFNLVIQAVRVFSDDIAMVFDLDKCAVLVLKSEKMFQTERIELPDGKRIKEVDLEGYKYLGVLQLDSIMNREIKKQVKSQYIRRVKKLLRSQLNGVNVVGGMNA